MQADCSIGELESEGLGGRLIVANLQDGVMISDAEWLVLQPASHSIGPIERVAARFVDYGIPELVMHGLPSMVGQRIASIGAGYEDINDHDDLRLTRRSARAQGADRAPRAGKRTSSPGACAIRRRQRP